MPNSWKLDEKTITVDEEPTGAAKRKGRKDRAGTSGDLDTLAKEASGGSAAPVPAKKKKRTAAEKNKAKRKNLK